MVVCKWVKRVRLLRSMHAQVKNANYSLHNINRISTQDEWNNKFPLTRTVNNEETKNECKGQAVWYYHRFPDFHNHHKSRLLCVRISVYYIEGIHQRFQLSHVFQLLLQKQEFQNRSCARRLQILRAILRKIFYAFHLGAGGLIEKHITKTLQFLNSV